MRALQVLALRRNWWLLLLGIVLGGVLGGALVVAVPTTYAATAVLTASSPSRVPTYVQLASAESIVDPVASELAMDRETVREHASVTQVVATSLLRSTATASTSDQAIELANAFAESFATEVNRSEQEVNASPEQVFISVSQLAETAVKNGDAKTQALLFGAPLVSMVVLSMLAAYLRTRRGLKLKVAAEVTGIVLRGPLAILPMSPEEQVSVARRAQPLFVDEDRVIGITALSANTDGFKVAVALGEALATARSVLIIDANQPSGAQSDTDGPGLAEVLLSTSRFQDVVRVVSPNLSILSSGEGTFAWDRMIGSAQFYQLITEFSSAYETVIVNTPSQSSSSFAALPKMAAGVILVVALGIDKDTALADGAARIAESAQNLAATILLSAR